MLNREYCSTIQPHPFQASRSSDTQFELQTQEIICHVSKHHFKLTGFPHMIYISYSVRIEPKALNPEAGHWLLTLYTWGWSKQHAKSSRITSPADHNKTVYPPHTKTSVHLWSFFVKSSRDWYDLPPETVHLINHIKFKEMIAACNCHADPSCNAPYPGPLRCNKIKQNKYCTAFALACTVGDKSLQDAAMQSFTYKHNVNQQSSDFSITHERTQVLLSRPQVWSLTTEW